jgi:hypothetical protein
MWQGNSRMKANGNIALSDQEVEYLRQIHVASAIRQLFEMPGWEFYQKIVADMLARLEDQHLNFAGSGNAIATKDAYYASGVRLGGAREFAKVLTDQIAQAVDILNQPLRPPQAPDPADFDGDENGKDD